MGPFKGGELGAGWGDFSGFVEFIVFLLAVSQTRDLEASLAPRGVKWALRIFLDRSCASMYPWRGCFSIPWDFNGNLTEVGKVENTHS